MNRPVLATRLAGLLCTSLLAACGSSAPPDVASAAGPAGASAAETTPCNTDVSNARVVVGVIDSAFNPYHEFYHAGSSLYKDCAPSSVTPEVLAEIGVPPENIIELSRTGNISRDRKTDAEIWKKVRKGKPYWIKGTNLIGVSFASSNDNRLVPMADKNPHGVGVTASVLEANRDAVVVFAETWDDYANDAAHEYTFLHPAVDIVNTSFGWCVPVVCTLGFPSPTSYAHTYDAVVNRGKLHVVSAGNEPGIAPLHGGPGSWWGIGVGGIEEHSSGGQTAMARNLPDFVGDYTQPLPYCQDCERGTQNIGGTSFSSPRAAGTISKVLLEARRALGHQGGITTVDGVPVMAAGEGRVITNWQMRRALEVAAFQDFSVADYDPAQGATDLVGVPINDAAPWLQTGWGMITDDPERQVVTEALAQLGFGTPVRTKTQENCDFQAANVRARMAYHDSADEPVPDPNPYIFCDTQLP